MQQSTFLHRSIHGASLMYNFVDGKSSYWRLQYLMKYVLYSITSNLSITISLGSEICTDSLLDILGPLHKQRAEKNSCKLKIPPPPPPPHHHVSNGPSLSNEGEPGAHHELQGEQRRQSSPPSLPSYLHLISGKEGRVVDLFKSEILDCFFFLIDRQTILMIYCIVLFLFLVPFE